MKAAFLTVVYPGIENFFEDFLLSLSEQTHSNFDLFVFNDGLSNLNQFIENYQNRLNIVIENTELSPVKIREYGINKILNSGLYDAIIFGDSDDYFSKDRVLTNLRLLTSCDIVLNDLALVSQDKKMIDDNYLSNRLIDGQVVNLDFVRDKNVFGLSNTAVSTKNIDKVTFPEGLIALDWYFFSELLLKGFKANFSSEAKTYYRQHVSNTVGMREFSVNSMSRGINVKTLHYKALADIDSSYIELYRKFLQLQKNIELDKDALEHLYRKIINKNIMSPLWWERECLPEMV